MILREQLLSLKNKEFIFKCLKILEKSGTKNDVESLVNPEICKRKFNMNFSILQKVNNTGSIDKEYFCDNAGNRRYYPNPIIMKGQRYIVCNDWYYNNKINRDTRTDFIDWILSL